MNSVRLTALPGDVLEVGPSGRTAIFGPEVRPGNRPYRYLLEIPTAPQKTLFSKDTGQDIVTFAMLNPSTADHNVNDPTITRVVNFATKWGYGAVRIVNLFAYRSTDPDRILKECGSLEFAIGPHNLDYIEQAVQGSTRVVAAWGTTFMKAPFYKDQVRRVLGILDGASRVAISCLDWTQDGAPKHPLYISSAFNPTTYDWRRRIYLQELDNNEHSTAIRGDYLTSPEEAVAEVLAKSTVGESGAPTYLTCLGKLFKIERGPLGKVTFAPSRLDYARKHRSAQELSIELPPEDTKGAKVLHLPTPRERERERAFKLEDAST
jgi:hypothetical protein